MSYHTQLSLSLLRTINRSLSSVVTRCCGEWGAEHNPPGSHWTVPHPVQCRARLLKSRGTPLSPHRPSSSGHVCDLYILPWKHPPMPLSPHGATSGTCAHGPPVLPAGAPDPHVIALLTEQGNDTEEPPSLWRAETSRQTAGSHWATTGAFPRQCKSFIMLVSMVTGVMGLLWRQS